MPRRDVRCRALRVTAGPALTALLLLTSGCGAGDGPASLPDDTYQRVLAQGVDPALVHSIELDGYELAEQSAGVLGDSDYGATYLPAEPPFTDEVRLTVRAGGYDEARCEQDPLSGPSGGTSIAVESCEADASGWYRTAAGWHEYVLARDGLHLALSAPTDAVDRETLIAAARDARPQDATASVTMTPSSPVTRGDLPTTGDGAPVDPGGTDRPGG